MNEQLWSAARQAIIAVTAFGVGRGWLADDTSTLVLAVLGLLGPVLASQWQIRARNAAA